MTHCSPNLFPCPLGTHSPTFFPYSWMWPCEWAETMSPFLDLVCKNPPLDPPPARGNLRRHGLKMAQLLLAESLTTDGAEPPTHLVPSGLMWMSNKLLLGRATEGSGYIFLVAGTHNNSGFVYLASIHYRTNYVNYIFLFSVFLILWHLWSYWLGRHCCPHHPGPANS